MFLTHDDKVVGSRVYTLGTYLNDHTRLETGEMTLVLYRCTRCGRYATKEVRGRWPEIKPEATPCTEEGL